MVDVNKIKENQYLAEYNKALGQYQKKNNELLARKPALEEAEERGSYNLSAGLDILGKIEAEKRKPMIDVAKSTKEMERQIEKFSVNWENWQQKQEKVNRRNLYISLGAVLIAIIGIVINKIL